MKKSSVTLKRLGDYIQEVDVRNRDLSVKKLMGINIGKWFMPSVANVVGTDLSNYKIVKKGQFACNLMHVGRDEKIPMALNNGEEIIVSPAYFVFEINNSSLLSDFLNLIFKRPEFDRNAWFHTDSDVRGGMERLAFKDLQIPVPAIEEQRRIVARYQAIQNRIEINKQTISRLESAAQALYRKMFVDDIDPENLPAGWRMGTLGEVAEINIGRTPPRNEENWFSIKEGMEWISIKDLSLGTVFVLRTNERLIFEAVKKFKIPKIPRDTVVLSFKMTIGRVAITTDEMLSNEAIAFFVLKTDEISREYLYLFLKYFDYRVLGTTSSIVNSINTTIIKNIEIFIPRREVLLYFSSKIQPLLNEIKFLEKQNLLFQSFLTLMI